MKDSFENKNTTFVFPDLEKERGEIGRVARVFAPEDINAFVERFYERSKKATLMVLSEDTWSQLENTDSYDIALGAWKEVEYHAIEGKPEAPRDWKVMRDKIEQHQLLEAPIVVKMGDRYHLVSGNTRLMVVRALGITPEVLVVDWD
ncbi:MAG TPA: hypothetical protein VJH94_00695 [Candidatus Paceibacterota bacterium]